MGENKAETNTKIVTKLTEMKTILESIKKQSEVIGDGNLSEMEKEESAEIEMDNIKADIILDFKTEYSDI